MTDHIPVLNHAVIRKLSLSSDDVVLDGTVGAGGHARAICARLEGRGSIVGIDQDKSAVEQTRHKLKQANCDANTCLQVGNFRHADKIIAECGFASIDAALLDLGFRSEQLEDERGFSFQEDAPLLMTFKHPDDLTEDDTTAQEVVQDWSQEVIEQVLRGYANESYSERIAKKIVATREDNQIKTTKQLVNIVKEAVPEGYKKGQRHPATKTFQAIRMAVNDEVRALEDGLDVITSQLSEGGRFVVISFQSVEDRITKNFFDQQAERGLGSHLTPSPIRPKGSETNFNARAHSAKLRCFQKTL
jgi:16S rRNA (cytosine1402-N4)-methyltransferase